MSDNDGSCHDGFWLPVAGTTRVAPARPDDRLEATLRRIVAADWSDFETLKDLLGALPPLPEDHLEQRAGGKRGDLFDRYFGVRRTDSDPAGVLARAFLASLAELSQDIGQGTTLDD